MNFYKVNILETSIQIKYATLPHPHDLTSLICGPQCTQKILHQSIDPLFCS